jgi:hypothetical protein
MVSVVYEWMVWSGGMILTSTKVIWPCIYSVSGIWMNGVEWWNDIDKQKGNMALSMAWTHRGAAEVWLHSFLPAVLDGGEWLSLSPDRFTPGKNPSIHWIGGPHGSLDILEKGIISRSFTGGGETKVHTEKSIHCHFIHHKSHINALGLKLGVYGDSPVTNCLSYGTTWYSITKQPNNWTIIYSCISVILHKNTHLPGSRSGYPIVWP